MLVAKNTNLERNTKLQVIHVPLVFVVLLLRIKLALQLFVVHPAQILFGREESAVIMNAQMTKNLRRCVQEEMDLFVHQIIKLTQISAYLKLLIVKIKNWKSCTMVTAALKVSLNLRKIIYTLPPSKQGEFYLRTWNLPCHRDSESFLMSVWILAIYPVQLSSPDITETLQAKWPINKYIIECFKKWYDDCQNLSELLTVEKISSFQIFLKG